MINHPRLIGKYDFHNNPINWSYLILGNVALTQINTYIISPVFIANHGNGIPRIGNQPPKNSILIMADIKIICEYSAKKNCANVIAEYSTLYPDTSSDSPSVKSNGVRLVSANADTKNITNAGNCGTIYQISSCPNTIPVKFNSPLLITTVKIINPIDTS